MSRGLSTFIIAIMLLIGVGFFIYPDVASWWNGRTQRGIVVEFDEYVAQMQIDERAAILQQARDYNAARPEISISDPFADAADLPHTYTETLNVGGVMARVVIPAINVNLPIFHGTSSYVLDRAAGHLHGTHMPIGGYGTHSVVTAHSGLSNARMFTDLLSDQVGHGTLFYIVVMGERLLYEVDDIRAVLPHEVDSLRVYPGRDLVTLITCTPLTVNSHRLLVRGTRIPYSPELIAEIVPYITIFTTNWRLISVLVIFFLFLLIFTIYQVVRILRGRHSKMLERKIVELERQLAHHKQKSRNPAHAAGPNHEINDPYIAVPLNRNPNPQSSKTKHISPAALERAKARAKRRKANQNYMQKVSIGIAMLLLLGGAGVLFYPQVQRQLHDRYAQALIEEFREGLEESREFIRQRWADESNALWEAISDLPIANNGNVYVAESGHIFLSHAEHVAFGAGATPAIDQNGYLTLGGAPVAANGVITIGNISVGHSGSLNISTHGSASLDNITIGINGIIYIGNYNIGEIAIETLDISDFNLDFIFNFDPVNDDPLQWLNTEMIEYNHELYEDGQSNLVSLESTEEVDFSVVQQGGFSEEMLGYITIERINVSLPIFAGSSYGNMLRGAAHLTQSSLPVGGVNTNAVITAHRGLSRARMFRNIDDLRVGDEIRITNFYQTLVYRVISPIEIIDPDLVYSTGEHSFVIVPDDIYSVKIVPGRDLITLFSCEPYRINSHRILVVAERVLD